MSAKLLKYGDKKLWEQIHAPIQVIWAPGEKNVREPANWNYTPLTEERRSTAI